LGSFYTSHALHGPTQKAVLDYLGARSALVSKTENGFTVVLDEACESQDPDEISALGRELSAQFECPVLAVLNHDTSLLYFELFENGKTTDQYNSSPSDFDEDAGDTPVGGNAARIAAAFGVADGARIESVLRREDYGTAEERHRDLAAVIGIPAYGVNIGFNYASEDDVDPVVQQGAYIGTRS
jgi:hypothetical protein